MEGFDVFTLPERAIWIAEKLIDLEVPYETEPWKGREEEDRLVRIVVPQEHGKLLDYLHGRVENEIDDPGDL